MLEGHKSYGKKQQHRGALCWPPPTSTDDQNQHTNLAEPQRLLGEVDPSSGATGTTSALPADQEKTS